MEYDIEHPLLGPSPGSSNKVVQVVDIIFGETSEVILRSRLNGYSRPGGAVGRWCLEKAAYLFRCSPEVQDVGGATGGISLALEKWLWGKG